MAKGRQKHPIGVRLKPADLTANPLVDDGDIAVDSNDDKLKARLASGDKEVITNDQTQTLENKTIDGTSATGNNTITADADDITYNNATSGLTATDTQAAIDEVEGRLDTAESDITTNATNHTNHLNDTTDAHDASAISYVNTTSGLTATDTQAAIDEIEGRVDADEQALADHLADATDAHDASAISYVNTTSGLTATDAQAAIDEVEGRLDTAETTLSAKPDLTATTDNRLARTDGSTDIQESGITVDDSDAVSGITDLTVDDININGSTVQSQNSQQLNLTSNTDVTKISPALAHNVSNSSVTGADASLSEITGIVRLTNASLQSIADINDSIDGHEITLINETGNDISLINGATPGAGQYTIQTGTKKDLTLKDEASITLTCSTTDSAWKVIGGTGSDATGVINYILNPDAEANTDGWSTYADAAGVAPVDGTGGVATITLTRSETTPLRGVASFLLSKPASNEQGEGASYDFTIDEADKAKMLKISFDYNVGANYADGDIRVYIYDVTNSNLIELTQRDLLSVDSSLNGTYRGYFQSASDSTSYRLIFHISSTNATAYDLKFDNVKTSPIESFGSQTIVSDWKDFTPTFTNDTGLSLTTYARYRRVGSSAEIYLDLVVNGTGTDGSPFLVSVDEVGNIDTSNFPDGAVVGSFFIRNASASTTQEYQSGMITYVAADGGGFRFSATSGAGNNILTTSRQLLGSDLANGDLIRGSFTLPILGWESGTKPNEVISGREVSARLTDASGQSIPNNSFTKVTWDTTDFDSTGSWDGTNNRFVAPESGTYKISAKISFNTLNWATATNCQCAINLNGTQYSTTVDELDATTGINVTKTVQIDELISLTKGDYIEIFAYQNSGSAEPLETNANRNSLNVHKLNSLSSQIQPTEDVIVAYTSDSGQVTNTGDTIIYEDKLKDTHNAYDTSTGTFTAPVSGVYEITASAWSNQTGWTITQTKSIQFRVNDTNPYYILDHHEQQTSDNSGSTMVINLEGTVKIPLNKGDFIKIITFHSPTTVTMGGTSSVYNKLFIQKVGN